MIRFNNITEKQITETAIVFALIAILASVYTAKPSYLIISIVLLLVILIYPTLLKPLAYFWFNLSKGLGRITSLIILTIIFYLLVTPVGFIRRFAGKDVLQTKPDRKKSKTMFKDRNHVFTSGDLLYPF